jgi:hypothetical protein
VTGTQQASAITLDEQEIARPVKNRFKLSKLGNTAFLFAVIALLVLGWLQREDSYLEAEAGLGYALGIVGGSMMLLLLIYPLRKRLKALNRFLSVKFWFRTHMLFGILGPVAILYHSSFSLGSTNSNVALFCMLLVASSGLVGRYLYIQIHHGLYGARTRVSEFQQQANERREILIRAFPGYDHFGEELDSLEKISVVPAHGLMHSLKIRRLTRSKIRSVRSTMKKITRQNPVSKDDQFRSAEQRSINNSIDAYFTALKRAGNLQVNERLFAWWHILHLPLFIMMLFSGIVHVFVVHTY